MPREIVGHHPPREKYDSTLSQECVKFCEESHSADALVGVVLQYKHSRQYEFLMLMNFLFLHGLTYGEDCFVCRKGL